MYGVTWTHLTQSLHVIAGYSLHKWLVVVCFFVTLLSDIVMHLSLFLDAPPYRRTKAGLRLSTHTTGLSSRIDDVMVVDATSDYRLTT